MPAPDRRRDAKGNVDEKRSATKSSGGGVHREVRSRDWEDHPVLSHRAAATFPTANEIVYDNYNFFVIGYSSSDRPSDCIVSIAAAANGVGLSFYYGSSLPDPEKRLLGNGKQNRFIRLPSAAVLEEPAVDALLNAAAENGTVPLPATGRGRTIIKSISAKQRPRRH